MPRNPHPPHCFKPTLSIECANDFAERVGGNPESEYLKPTRLLQLSNATLIRGSILDIAAAMACMPQASVAVAKRASWIMVGEEAEAVMHAK